MEIGAGTGGTTAAVLDGLHSLGGERLYGSYTVTDISAGFVNRCKERFQKYGNLSYAVLDISADPRDQGFEMGSFDVVLSSNVSKRSDVLMSDSTDQSTIGDACYTKFGRDHVEVSSFIETRRTPVHPRAIVR